MSSFHRASRDYLADESNLRSLEELETRARRKDGEEFPIELTVCRPVSLGRRRVFYGFLRDLTEQRRGRIEPEPEDAAASALVGITAPLGLVGRAGVREGETVFVVGGTGGVGSMVVQVSIPFSARRSSER